MPQSAKSGVETKGSRDFVTARISPTSDGVLFLRGFASSMRVENGHLVVRSGSGRKIREARLARGSRTRIRRVVLMGKGGFVTLEALGWLKGVGASLLCLDASGEHLVVSGHEGPDQPALRRAQALGEHNGSALEITRYLLGLKLEGQAQVAREHLQAPATLHQKVTDATRIVLEASSTRDMLTAEAKAARAYWRAWESIPIQFARADIDRVPEHWTRVGERNSPLAAGPRQAAAPAHAILNLLYALAEFECRVALVAIGLDPGLGWFHRDAAYRQSAALDVMEAVRPTVDQFVVETLKARTFSAREFRELPNGQVRVTPGLAQMLAASMLPLMERAAAAPTEEVARTVAADAESFVRVRTPLTQSDRKKGRKPHTKRAASIPSACRLCGVVLERPDRQHCPDCVPTMTLERTKKLSTAGRDKLREMRKSSADPAKSPSAKAKRSARLVEHAAATSDWERVHGRVRDPVRHDAEVLPVMRAMTVKQLAALTGLSEYHCWRVRKGDRRLHPRFWQRILED